MKHHQVSVSGAIFSDEKAHLGDLGAGPNERVKQIQAISPGSACGPCVPSYIRQRIGQRYVVRYCLGRFRYLPEVVDEFAVIFFLARLWFHK